MRRPGHKMLAISEKTDRSSSSWCIVCITQCGPADQMVCDQCKGYVTTWYICPECGTQGQFNGYDIPEFCTCGYFWPDINFLKEDLDARIDFHMGES